MLKLSALKNWHTLESFPDFPCPRCNATLVPTNDGFKFEQSAESRITCDLAGSDPEYVEGVFTLWLQCSSKKCQDLVTCSGRYVLEQVENSHGQEEYVPSLQPRYFYPSILLFSPPVGIPERVAQPLKEAFSLFWANPSAAGNSLRISIEALLDYRCIKKWTKNKAGEEVAMPLHHRIKEFEKHSADLAEKLLAIKWIGNGGSHLSGLKHEDMVKAFRLYEYVVEELFEKRSESLTKLSKRINRKKGPA